MFDVVVEEEVGKVLERRQRLRRDLLSRVRLDRLGQIKMVIFSGSAHRNLLVVSS